MIRSVAIALLLGSCSIHALAQMSRPLFFLERSTNANVVHYDVQIGPDGKLDPREPVIAYWIMAAEDGRRQPLTRLEKSKAYGFQIQPGDSLGSVRMLLVSQKGKVIRVFLDGDSAKAETSINGARAFLRRIYVHTKKSGLLRTADYYELFGISAASGSDCYEKIRAP